MSGCVRASLCLGLLLSATPAAADPQFFWSVVNKREVTYGASCVAPTPLFIYTDRASAPTAGTPADQTGTCPNVVWNAPDKIHLYRSWASLGDVTATSNNIAGPIEVCVGPDLTVKSFQVETNGAQVTYKATVCNAGSMAGEKFRVGFWHDRATAPAATEMGDVFKGIASLAAQTYTPPTLTDPVPKPVPTCVDVQVPGGLRPNGTFKAWCRADSGDFTVECREGNNGADSVVYTLNNPDLDLASFSASVAGSTVSYDVTVCNRGTAAVSKFYLDTYFHRPKAAPIVGEPGDLVKPVMSLAAGGCIKLQFQRSGAPNGSYLSYAFADPDDFISEPNEINNLSRPLPVQVGAVLGPGSGCVDNDKDGYSVGPDCKGEQDCNDGDANIHPGAKESCGDGLDQNCNLTVDDGCPGVDCVDNDGDGWGVGKACVLPDCDDNNKAIHPLAAEICGDNKDDNCNGIADDGCPGRQCIDQDGDGYGVGKACPGQQDCNDNDFVINPGRNEVCGDGVDNDCNGVADDADSCSGTVDNDADGWAVGAVSPGPPDCNDADPAVHPGAQEICGDKIDNNCNGSIDEGCPGVDCVDKDGDGWPAGNGCAGPQDCDDNNSAIHPWGTEVCGDKIDNNCNFSIDEGCRDVDCKDSDHDGWPAGKDCDKAHADCNDSKTGLSPWMPEICGDGKDNNCNGAIDEGCPVCEDADADGYGVGPKCTNWDCDDKDPQSHPGAVEICDNKDNNCNATVDDQCQGGCGCGMSTSTGAPGAAALLLLALLLFAARRRS